MSHFAIYQLNNLLRSERISFWKLFRLDMLALTLAQSFEYLVLFEVLIY